MLNSVYVHDKVVEYKTAVGKIICGNKESGLESSAIAIRILNNVNQLSRYTLED